MSEVDVAIDSEVPPNENFQYVGTDVNDISLRLGSTTDDERECYGINKTNKQRSSSGEEHPMEPNDLFVGER